MPAKRKRLMITIVIINLLLGCVATTGCARAGVSASKARQSRGPITIWYSTNPSEIAWGQQMVRAWNSTHRHERVTAERIPAGTSSEEVISAAIIAGNEPCLIYNTAPAAVPGFQRQGGLVPLGDFPGATAGIEARSGTSTARQYLSPDGSYYQFPWKANPVMIFYNRRALSRAGISVDPPPLASFSDFLTTARRLVAAGVVRYAIYPAPSSEFYQSWFDFYPMYLATSGGQQLVAGGISTFDSEPGRAVASLWRQLYAEGLAGKEPYTGDSFAEGTTALAMVGPWAIATYHSKVDWGLVPVPTERGGAGSTVPTFSDAKNIGMYASCEHRATAWDLLRFSTSVEQDGKLLAMTGQMPLRAGLATSYAPFFTTHPEYRPFALATSGAVDVPNVARSVEIWQTFRDAWSRSVIFGREDPARALAGAARKITALAGRGRP